MVLLGGELRPDWCQYRQERVSQWWPAALQALLSPPHTRSLHSHSHTAGLKLPTQWAALMSLQLQPGIKGSMLHVSLE